MNEYELIYEIPNKMIPSTVFNAGFILLAVCTVLMALSWIGFGREKKLWRAVTIIFNLVIVGLWCVHFVTTMDPKKAIVDNYYNGIYEQVVGVVTEVQDSTKKEKGYFKITYEDNGTRREATFDFPHPSKYGFTGGNEIATGSELRISYIPYEVLNDNSDPKCIVKIEKKTT